MSRDEQFINWFAEYAEGDIYLPYPGSTQRMNDAFLAGYAAAIKDAAEVAESYDSEYAEYSTAADITAAIERLLE